MEHLKKIGAVILVVSVIHLLGVALTCLLAKSINKANYEEIR
jgi:hypothetical protein